VNDGDETREARDDQTREKNRQKDTEEEGGKTTVILPAIDGIGAAVDLASSWYLFLSANHEDSKTLLQRLADITISVASS
jgi:hypothetical protein